nr:hypothetical protein [Mycolicibacterium malmesburyense]
MTADPEPPGSPNAVVDDERSRRYGKHWAWFVGVLALLGIAGFGLSVVAMLPLAMATDGCYETSTDAMCSLSARGQNVLVFIPWMCLAVGTAASIAGAGVAARLRRTPLLGIPVGIAAYVAMIPVGYALAFQV